MKIEDGHQLVYGEPRIGVKVGGFIHIIYTYFSCMSSSFTNYNKYFLFTRFKGTPGVLKVFSD